MVKGKGKGNVPNSGILAKLTVLPFFFNLEMRRIDANLDRVPDPEEEEEEEEEK